MHLRPERVRQGLHGTHEWALNAKTQAAVHLLPLLALLEKGAGTRNPIKFEENDDFDFWNRYFLVVKGDPKPYFTPITLKRVEKGFPHSNAATVRKNTFDLKWHAGSRDTGEDGSTIWSLAQDYATIFRDKVLTKGGTPFKSPILDLAAILFRNDEFSEGATAETILQRFRARFQQKEEDFSTLFSYRGEAPDALFTASVLDIPKAYDDVILVNLVPDKIPAPPGSGVQTPTPLDDTSDPVLVQVQQILSLGTSGVIFSGPPGTGKTWYAQKSPPRSSTILKTIFFAFSFILLMATKISLKDTNQTMRRSLGSKLFRRNFSRPVNAQPR